GTPRSPRSWPTSPSTSSPTTSTTSPARPSTSLKPPLFPPESRQSTRPALHGRSCPWRVSHAALSERHRLYLRREGHPDGERLTSQLRQGRAPWLADSCNP